MWIGAYKQWRTERGVWTPPPPTRYATAYKRSKFLDYQSDKVSFYLDTEQLVPLRRDVKFYAIPSAWQGDATHKQN